MGGAGEFFANVMNPAHMSQMRLMESRLQGSATLQEQNHWLALIRIQEQARNEANRLDQAHGNNLELEEQRHRNRIDEEKNSVINGALSGVVAAILQNGLKTTDLHNDIVRRAHETHSRIRESLAEAQVAILQAKALAQLEEDKAERNHQRQLELLNAAHAQNMERDNSQGHMRRAETFFTKYCEYIFDLLTREEDERARRAIDELEKKWREEGFRIIDEEFFPDFGQGRSKAK